MNSNQIEFKKMNYKLVMKDIKKFAHEYDVEKEKT
jgi:hypothetical protein